MTHRRSGAADMEDSRQRALAYLNTNRLRHLVHLKFLHRYSDSITCVYEECDGDERPLWPMLQRIYLHFNFG